MRNRLSQWARIGLCSAATLVAALAHAQSETTPAPAEPAAGIQVPDDAMRNDGRMKPLTEEGFVKAAAQAALAETEVSRVALDRSRNLRVNLLADRVVKDQNQVSRALREAAGKQRVAVPDKLDVEHQAVVSTLRLQARDKFDAAYVAQMRESRNKTTALLEQAKNSASLSAPLREFADKSLELLQGSQDQLQRAAPAKSMTMNSDIQ